MSAPRAKQQSIHYAVHSIFIISLFLLLTSPIANAQIANAVWIWQSGDNTSGTSAVRGTQGTPGTAYSPGARQSYCEWTDASGNFWLFGGITSSSSSDAYNDLWKYTPSTKQWTWVSGSNTVNQSGTYGAKGTAAAANKPGSRYGATNWKDASGNFWLFGGNGRDANGNSGVLSDLWRYNPATNQWTWMSGDNVNSQAGVYGTKTVANAGNKPGSRFNASGAADASGNFWLFGGGTWSIPMSFYNDLWKYNIATNQWTWMSGDNTMNSTGVYGTKGTAAAANKPGGRDGGACCIDGSGNLWLFGGMCQYQPNNSNVAYCNDLWRYNIAAGQWTWLSGDNDNGTAYGGSYGAYGTKGVGATGNTPGSKFYGGLVADVNGNVWLFGGGGYAAGGNLGVTNDLWAYTPSSRKWTWVSGDNSINAAAVYGTKGSGSTSNKPSARADIAIWLDAGNNLWTYGGTNMYGVNYGDLWQFNRVTLLTLDKLTVQGVRRNNNNVLTWQTEGEKDIDEFIVERSSNGITYTAIGSALSLGDGSHNYAYTDQSSISGTCYYRILAKDIAAQGMYSSIVTLDAGTAPVRVTIYPNPAINQITIECNDNSLLNTTARLYDASGRMISQFNINSTKQAIDLRNAAKGVLTLQLANGKSYSIVKE